MLDVITEQDRLEAAVRKFRTIIRDLGDNAVSTEWRYPHGDRDTMDSYVLETEHGPLLIGLQRHQRGVYRHMLLLEREDRGVSPDAEINIPEGHNRHISGTIVQDSHREQLICSRGRFTSFRGAISKETALTFFEKSLIRVWDVNEERTLIRIAALNADTIADELARYVRSVVMLKAQHKDQRS